MDETGSLYEIDEFESGKDFVSLVIAQLEERETVKVHNDTATQFRQFSRTASIAGIKLPDFNDSYVFTRKKTETSDSEYKKKIILQAKQDFLAGKFQNQSQGFNRLMKKYVSEVSPDRQGIITTGLKEVANRKSNLNRPIDVMALLLDGKLKYQDGVINSPYAEFYDDNGELIAKYSNGGWTMYTTNAESARQIDMCQVYNKAWGEAKNESVAFSSSINSSKFESFFDEKV